MDALKRVLKKSPQKLQLLNELLETSIDGARDIFVNRHLDLSHIQYVGFDMDYTLAIYNKKAIEELAFQETLSKLVALCGYPEDVLNLQYQVDDVIRGLLIDQKKGNLVKINRFKQVSRVYHGETCLAHTVYYNDKIDQSANDRFTSVDTLFSLPEAYLYAQLVEKLEAGQLPDKDFSSIFKDIRHCLDLCHKDGSLKSKVIQDVGHYVYKDPHLPLTLDKFRDSGKKLFLLTNSEWFYTDIVMSYLLEGHALETYSSWRDYFDIVIVDSRKPDFFKGQTPFYQIDESTNQSEWMNTDQFEPGKVYQNGNYTQFEALIQSQGNEVLYIGDHIYGDILRSGKDSNWRTALVVQELEEELRRTAQLYEKNSRLKRNFNKWDKLHYQLHLHTSQRDSLHTLKTKLDNFTPIEKAIFEDTLRDLDEKILTCQKEMAKTESKLTQIRQDIDEVYHPKWGPLFHENDEISRFGDQVRDYACLYTSRVSNFFFYPTDRYFKSLRDIMPHDRWLELESKQ